MRRQCRLILWALVFAALLLPVASAAGAQGPPETEPVSPLKALQDELSSYFRPFSGKVLSITETTAAIIPDSGATVRTGARLTVFSQGVAFTHPVTKESLGRIEAPVGVVEVTDGGAAPLSAAIMSGNPGDFADAKVKMPGTQVRVLFSQGATNWYVGDTYFRMLKDSGRFELIETATLGGDVQALLVEAGAKGADVVVALESEEVQGRTTLTQKLLWTKDRRQFSAMQVSLDPAALRQIKLQRPAFGRIEGEVLMSYNLPFRARRVAAGNISGTGGPEIVLAAGNSVKVYSSAVDLALVGEFTIPFFGDIIWIGTAASEKENRDLILVTALRSESLASFVYRYTGSEFVMVTKLEDTFLRVTESGIIGQNYFRKLGYDGNVFALGFEGGTLRKGAPLSLPKGVNIYDFQFLTSPDGRRALLVWEESGQLSLYNLQGVRTWMSAESYGGVTLSFSRDPQPGPEEEATAKVLIDRGKWTLKDRFILMEGEALAPLRIPLLGAAKGLGYKSSQLRGILYNGITVEERAFVQDISGEILDYAVSGDRVFVLSRPILGMEAGKLLKAENPFVLTLSVYSTRGR